MGNIVTELPVEFDGNNGEALYTREKKIQELSIVPSSTTNILNADAVDNAFKIAYVNGVNGRISNFRNIIKINQGNALSGWNGLCSILFPTNMVIIGRKYRFVFEILKSNVENTTIEIREPVRWGTLPLKVGSRYIYDFIMPSGGYRSISFVTQTTIPSNAEVDILIRGLYDITDNEFIDIRESSINSKTTIYSQNHKEILGEYNMSKYIRKRLSQSEKSICKLEEMFNVDWR